MKKTNKMNPSAQIELMMLQFANAQQSILILDELPETDFFTGRYKRLCKEMHHDNLATINKLFKKMNTGGDDLKDFEYAFNKSQEVSEQMIKCIQNNSLGALLAMLKALNDGEIKQMPDGKHNKIMKHLETLEV